MTMRTFTPRASGSPAKLGRTTRIVEMTLGAWLVLSTVLWPHAPAQIASTCIVGVLIFGSALFARRMPLPTSARFLNVLLAFWLASSAWMLPPLDRLTVTNHIVVAAVIILLALVPSRSRRAS